MSDVHLETRITFSFVDVDENTQEMEEDDSTRNDDESAPLIRPERNTDSGFSSKQKCGLLSTYLIILFYFAPSFCYIVALEQDVNDRIALENNDTEGNRTLCLQANTSGNFSVGNEIQAEASNWMILVNVAGLLSSFFVTLLVGPVSDVLGRRIALLIPSLGALVKYGASLLISHYQWPIWSYAVCSFVEGLSGSMALFYGGCQAHVADHTSLSQRSLWLVVAELVSSLSAVIGTFCSGYLITDLGFTWLYIIAGIVQLLAVVLVLALIEGKISATGDFRIFSTVHFRRSKDLFCNDTQTNRRWKLLMLLVVTCCLNLGDIRLSDVQTYTMLNWPLCFSSIMIGNFYSLQSVVMTVGGFALIFLRRCGATDFPLLYASIASFVAFEVMICLAVDEKLFFSGELEWQFAAVLLYTNRASPFNVFCTECMHRTGGSTFATIDLYLLQTQKGASP